jgi:ElaB/YqjD/DUF883 family membrane-anchored ribosome-binding protein
MTQRPETRTADELREQARAVKEDLRRLGRTAGGVAQEKAGEAQEWASQRYTHGREKANELSQRVNGYVQENPLKSVIIAAGVGAFLGLMLSRR